MIVNEKRRIITENNEQIKDQLQDVFEAGKKSEHDEFWDVYQDYGMRTNYSPSFGGTGWTDVTFKPKYKLTIKNAQSAFGTCRVTDLVAATEPVGGMDFTGCTNFSYAFSYASTSRLGILDVSSAGNQLVSTFSNATKLRSIEKIIVSETNVFQASTFSKCTALEEIRFEGTIASDISFADSPLLSVESLENIMYSLEDFYRTDGEYTKTITLTQASVDKLI